MKLRKNQMKLPKNQMKLPNYFFFPPWGFAISSVGIFQIPREGYHVTVCGITRGEHRSDTTDALRLDTSRALQ